MMSVVMALITVVLAVLVFTCSDWSGNVLICNFQTIPGVTAVVEVMALVGRWRLVSEYRNYSAV